MPPSLVQVLRSFSEIPFVFSFDDEPQIQRELLSTFPGDRVVFASRPPRRSETTGFPPVSSFIRPQAKFLVEVDGETYALPQITADIPWLLDSEVFIVRCTLGYFWSGEGDLCQIVQLLDQSGFEFFEISEYFKLHLFNAPQSRVALIFRKKVNQSAATPRGNAPYAGDEKLRFRRIGEALAFLSKPVARVSNLVRLAGRGSFGYEAGVLNPGAIRNGDEILLLARGEHVPWVRASHDVAKFLESCRAMLLNLDNKQAITRVDEAVFVKSDGKDGVRMEDFRLFRFQGRLYSNHSTFAPLGEVAADQPRSVQFESSRIGVGISEVDVTSRQLRFLGSPALDCSTGPVEKNWAMFDHAGDLYLIYSFSPFHLLRAGDWPKLNFKTVCRETIELPWPDDGLMFRNSANPVDYDGNYFLHMVHKVYPGKKYAFWAVLVEKNSLLPAKISARPLVCGWQSAPAAITYACSLVARQNDVLVFAGLNDTGMGFWRISRTELDASWTVLTTKTASK